MIKELTASDSEIDYKILVNDCWINTLAEYSDETVVYMDADEEPFSVKEKPEEIIQNSTAWPTLHEGSGVPHRATSIRTR